MFETVLSKLDSSPCAPAEARRQFFLLANLAGISWDFSDPQNKRLTKSLGKISEHFS